MKILFLTRSFYPNQGGVEKHILEISDILIKLGHSITVITEQPQNIEKSNYQSNSSSAKIMGKAKNIRIRRISVGGNDWFKKFRIWIQILKYTKEIKKADVVHCHDVFFWYFPFKILFPFKKVYTTFHGYEGNNLPTKKAILMHKFSEIFSNGNICVGDFLKKWYKTNPSFVIYGGVSRNIFNIKFENRSSKNNNKIIFIGRLEIETGIMEYLKALKILQEKGKKFVLDVYGKGKLENEVIKYSLDNALNVNLMGFKDNIEAIIPNYEYVFCSRYLGILESLACGKKVFAEYNNAIKKDYLTLTPFVKYISISGNAKELAINIERVILEKLNLNTKEAYKWVKNKTWGNVVATYLNLWNFIN